MIREFGFVSNSLYMERCSGPFLLFLAPSHGLQQSCFQASVSFCQTGQCCKNLHGGAGLVPYSILPTCTHFSADTVTYLGIFHLLLRFTDSCFHFSVLFLTWFCSLLKYVEVSLPKASPIRYLSCLSYDVWIKRCRLCLWYRCFCLLCGTEILAETTFCGSTCFWNAGVRANKANTYPKWKLCNSAFQLETLFLDACI